MAKIMWDQTGERTYETGVDHGVLYERDVAGEYSTGVAWNGLTTVTESPTGAEASPQYADNIKYLNLVSVEQFAATIEAFTFPTEFEKYDGSASPVPGLAVGQQPRKEFGFSYRTRKGNDVDGTEFGYKLHLIYGALAAPSEKAYATINDSPEAITFSYEISTTPVPIGVVGGVEYKPTASITIDSTKFTPEKMAALELILYGDASNDPAMPLPAEVIALMSGVVTEVNPTQPSFNAATDTITIPTVTGVRYTIEGETVPAGDVVITEDTLVKAYPNAGYKFPAVVDDEWVYDYTP